MGANLSFVTISHKLFLFLKFEGLLYAFDSATELLKLKLIEKLDLIQFQDFQYILIENQPTFKNPKMKAIADTLYSWFLIRKIVDAKTLFNWHYLLTGSCETGRISFCMNNNIDIENDSFSIYEFIELTKNSYGSETINKLN